MSWGTIIYRTYGTYKHLYTSLLLLTVFGPINYAPPRNSVLQKIEPSFFFLGSFLIVGLHCTTACTSCFVPGIPAGLLSSRIQTPSQYEYSLEMFGQTSLVGRSSADDRSFFVSDSQIMPIPEYVILGVHYSITGDHSKQDLWYPQKPIPGIFTYFYSQYLVLITMVPRHTNILLGLSRVVQQWAPGVTTRQIWCPGSMSYCFSDLVLCISIV